MHQAVYELEKQYGHLPSVEKNITEFLNGKIDKPEYINRILSIANTTHESGIKGYLFDTYKKLHGEAEARNSQTRMDMTAEERKGSHPYDTMDVNPEDTIVHFSDGTSMSIATHKADKILERLKSEVDRNKLTEEEKGVHDVYLGNKTMAEIRSSDLGDMITLSQGTNRKGAKKIMEV